MKKVSLSVLTLLILVLSSTGFAEEPNTEKKTDQLDGAITGLAAKVLLTDKLALAEGVEVVVSHLVVPPNTTLPVHWHHGEEYVYVLDGTTTLMIKDKEDVTLTKGDLYKIPLKAIHTAKTADESATVIVFRIHEEGQPVRVLVDEK